MILENISLINFRNIEETKIEFDKGLNVLIGDNGQGKTNILESVYFCATGRSHRTRFDNELISFGKNESHIKSKIACDTEKSTIDIHIKYGLNKGIAINGIPIKKLGDLFGNLKVVLFSPEDMQLINGGPSLRRRFMDIQICQMDRIYYFYLQRYYKALRQRNTLLKRQIKVSDALKEEVNVWNVQLEEYAKIIIAKRRSFIEKISERASKIQSSLTENSEELKIRYTPNVNENEFYEKLLKGIEKDVYYKTTLLGPHKDDLQFSINDLDVKTYASQGQKKSCAISVKLAEIETIKEETGDYPVLLLDDILSELDAGRQSFLFESITHVQCILTATGVEEILHKIIKNANIYNVSKGLVSKFES